MDRTPVEGDPTVDFDSARGLKPMKAAEGQLQGMEPVEECIGLEQYKHGVSAHTLAIVARASQAKSPQLRVAFPSRDDTAVYREG